jgi:hypothetical protein
LGESRLAALGRAVESARDACAVAVTVDDLEALLYEVTERRRGEKALAEAIASVKEVHMFTSVRGG